jgi:hypothetical protein
MSIIGCRGVCKFRHGAEGGGGVVGEGRKWVELGGAVASSSGPSVASSESCVIQMGKWWTTVDIHV